MKVSYNWLKWYIPDVPAPEKLADIFTYHICEVEGVEQKSDDTIFDINILPNRAHDLLSHQGVARELASLLDITYVDPTPKYKIPQSKFTELTIQIKTDKCKRYMGRIVRNITVGPSPEWVVKYLEAIGQRSINNIVDAANIVLFDCGQPTHVFDLDKMESKLIIRDAKEGEEITTLDNRKLKLKSSHMVVADSNNTLEIAGLKGGKIAEVNASTRNIILEVSNFEPVPVRKMSADLNLRTEGSKRHENNLSPERAEYAMQEFSALIAEMCPDAIFEDVVDVYPQKQEVRKLSFSSDRISKILGVDVSVDEVEDILKRYNFEYRPLPSLPLAKGEERGGGFEIVVPVMRLDLIIEEDMAEEIGRILGYDKVKPIIPEIKFKSKQNETYAKISLARNKLINEGYSEVMTTSFRNSGEVSVLASASDKKFLRANLSDGLKESMKLNKINSPLLGLKEVKIFEIGTIFKNSAEEMHITYNEEEKIIETSLDEFVLQGQSLREPPQGLSLGKLETKFHTWSLFPFIARDVAVWVGEDISSSTVLQVIKDNMSELVIRGPELFDEFSKDGKVSYAFRLVFQSYEKTLTDQEVNDVMEKINEKIKEAGWQVR